MKNNEKLYSITLASTALVLFLLVSFSAAASTQSESTAAPYAYITHFWSNTISVIDTATDTVTATVNVGLKPLGVAVNPGGTKVYVANWGSNNVSVIDTATNTVIASVPVGNNPWGVAVTPDGTKVYVVNEGSDNVSVIDTATNSVIATVNVGSVPQGIAVNPAGTKVYVVNDHSGNVSVIDTTTNTVTATVANAGGYPCEVAVNPTGTKVYVTNGGSLVVIDTTTNNVTATVNNVGGWPVGVTVAPDGTKVYVASSSHDILSVIDTTTNNVTAKVPVGRHPEGVAVNPDGTKVYVANTGGDTNYKNISVIDTATNTVISTVDVENKPMRVALRQFASNAPVPEVIGTSELNLTGVWSCDDGGTYYIRQLGDTIWWFGETSTNPGRWSNVAYGTVKDNIINLAWSDVPKGCAVGKGILVLNILSKDKLTATKKSGGFGGSTWTHIGLTTCPSSTNAGQESTINLELTLATPSNQGALNSWKDQNVRQLIDEWLLQQDNCLKKVHGSGAYMDKWGRICGELKSSRISCVLSPDHPADWDSYHYLWVHNWCPYYYPYSVQSYVKYRQAGNSFDSMAKCKGKNEYCIS